MSAFYKGMKCIDCNVECPSEKLTQIGWTLVRVAQFEFAILCDSCQEKRIMAGDESEEEKLDHIRALGMVKELALKNQ